MRTAEDKIAQVEISELEKLRRQFDETEGTLRPKLEPAIKRWRTAADELAILLNDEKKSLDEARAKLEAMQSRVEARAQEIDALTDLMRGYDESANSFGKLDANAASSEAIRKLDVGVRELATLSKMLRTAEDSARWLGEVNKLLLLSPSWWRFMPVRWQKRMRSERLRKSGLFDARAYLERYPDVARSRMDPLQHYIMHGQTEGRLR